MIALATSGRRIDLADADDAGVGVDLDDQRLLAAVAALVDIGQTQVDRFDAGDFHGAAPAVRRRPLRARIDPDWYTLASGQLPGIAERAEVAAQARANE